MMAVNMKVLTAALAAVLAMGSARALAPPVPSPCAAFWGERASGDLAGDLSSGDWDRQRCALAALQTRPAADLRPIVAGILSRKPSTLSSELRSAYELIEAMGDKAGEFLPQLMERLRSDDDYESGEAERPIASLGAQAVPALPEIFALHRRRANSRHLSLLGKIGRHAPEQALGYFDEIMRGQPDRVPWNVVISALGELAKGAPKPVVARLLAILVSPASASSDCNRLSSIVAHFRDLGPEAAEALPVLHELARSKAKSTACAAPLLMAIVSIDTPERAAAWVDGPMDDAKAYALQTFCKRPDSTTFAVPVLLRALQQKGLTGTQKFGLLSALEGIHDHSREVQRARFQALLEDLPNDWPADRVRHWQTTLRSLIEYLLSFPFLSDKIQPDLEAILKNPAAHTRQRELALELLNRRQAYLEAIRQQGERLVAPP